MSKQSVGDRLGKAIYFIGVAVAIGLCVMAVPSLVSTFRQTFMGINFLAWSPEVELLFYVLGATSAYAIGWCLRWIITGETTSFFDRFSKK